MVSNHEHKFKMNKTMYLRQAGRGHAIVKLLLLLLLIIPLLLFPPANLIFLLFASLVTGISRYPLYATCTPLTTTPTGLGEGALEGGRVVGTGAPWYGGGAL